MPSAGSTPRTGRRRPASPTSCCACATAGYGVVRCDDALAHRFDASLSHNPAAAAGARQTVAAPDAAALARGFDPARRVPFVRLAAVPRTIVASHAIAVPVANAAELERAAAFLAAAATAFDANAPVRLHVVLDGDVAPADAVARIRPALAASGKADGRDRRRARRARRRRRAPGALRSSRTCASLVAAGHERDALAGLTAVPASALRDLLEPVLR